MSFTALCPTPGLQGMTKRVAPSPPLTFPPREPLGKEIGELQE